MELDGPFVQLYQDDLAGMDDISEEKIAVAMGNRFTQGNYHTYAGDVLLIVNPQAETGLYEKKVILKLGPLII